MEFIGVDLGWRISPPLDGGTAICVMDSRGGVTRLELVTLDRDIISLIDQYPEAWVGIDAPLVVNNEAGLRHCERLLFDRGIRVLPASKEYLARKFGGCRGVKIANRLRGMGYSFPAPKAGVKVIFEVYPFGALHVLTGGRVPCYKRGPAGVRREAAIGIMRMIGTSFPITIPDSLETEIAMAPPSELKSAMDKLDAIISVLCVYSHWIYSGSRTELIGDVRDGFVLLPKQVIYDG